MVNPKAEVLAIIPARGGSKGIPRKNIKNFAGHPLIAYSIQAALSAETVTRVIVSTDDEEIAAVARQYGAQTPFLRPAEFSQDRTLDLPVFQHALEWLESGCTSGRESMNSLIAATTVSGQADRTGCLARAAPRPGRPRGAHPAQTPRSRFGPWHRPRRAKPA